MKTLKSLLDRIGISSTTGWRWRKRGWINTVTIAGRVYVTDEAVTQFESRAVAGEFAKGTSVPKGKENL